MAGLRAARANLVPGMIVQAVMLGLLLAYWFYPGHQIHKAPATTPLAPKAASTGHNIERCARTATMPALNSKLARPPSRPSPNAIASETSSPLAWYVPSSSPSPN